MNNRLYHFFYARPLWQVAAAVVALVLLGALLYGPLRGKRRRAPVCAALFLLVTAALLYVTLFRRSGGERGLLLTPFQSFRAIRTISREYIRLIVMNIAVFVPWGLFLAALWPGKWRPWLRVLLTAAAAFLFSSAIEQLQYHFSLGLTELDDILFNTFGAFLGALHIPPGVSLWRKRKEKR